MMKFNKMLPADVREGDDPKMVEAIDAFLAQGIDVRRPHNNNYQLKIAPDLSYYPTKRTILRDGGSTLSVRGLEAAIDLVNPGFNFE